jgi:hypothetical protein
VPDQLRKKHVRKALAELKAKQGGAPARKPRRRPPGSAPQRRKGMTFADIEREANAMVRAAEARLEPGQSPEDAIRMVVEELFTKAGLKEQGNAESAEAADPPGKAETEG